MPQAPMPGYASGGIVGARRGYNEGGAPRVHGTPDQVLDHEEEEVMSGE